MEAEILKMIAESEKNYEPNGTESVAGNTEITLE